MAQNLDGARDFSVLGMVQHADPVVQAIALLLVICSVASWAITFEKVQRLRRLAVEATGVEAHAVDGRLPLVDTAGVGGVLGKAATAELADGLSAGESRTDLRARLERAMRGALKTHLREIEGGLPFLATVGSTTPFVGLFGTVWGIMHAFTSIAQSRDTSLAVVAPGIAEALFVTALGLAAAIPAVVAYNLISVALGRAAERIGRSITVLARAASRSDSDKVRIVKGGK